MKIWCCLSGLSDVVLEDLRGRTPLEAATTPHLDQLIKEGSTTLHHPPVGSFAHSLATLRGLERVPAALLEGIGVGASVDRGTIVSVRLVGLDENMVIDVSRHVATRAEAKRFYDEVGGYHLEGVSGLFVFEDLVSLEEIETRAVLEMAGYPWWHALTAPLAAALFPYVDHLYRHPLRQLKRELGEPSLGLVVTKVARGRRRATKPTTKTVLYSETHEMKGLAKWAGWDVHSSSDLSRLEGEEVIVESSELWEATFEGDLLGKVKKIEWLDRHIVGPLKAHVDEKGGELFLHTLKRVDIRSGSLVDGPVESIRYEGKEPVPQSRG